MNPRGLEGGSVAVTIHILRYPVVEIRHAGVDSWTELVRAQIRSAPGDNAYQLPLGIDGGSTRVSIAGIFLARHRGTVHTPS